MPAPSSTRTRTARLIETPVTGGRCKLQWKPDWAMRWYALGVDYEMSGKDLIASVELASKICRILGASRRRASTTSSSSTRRAQKISKPKGNGLSVEEWLDLRAAGEPVAVHVSEAARGEAALFRRHPARGRRLSDLLAKFPARRTPAKQLENPVWHIHNGKPPDDRTRI